MNEKCDICDGPAHERDTIEEDRGECRDRLKAQLDEAHARGLAPAKTYRDRAEAADARAERLRAALEWYADVDNYSRYSGAPYDGGPDMGKRARLALAQSADAPETKSGEQNGQAQ